MPRLPERVRRLVDHFGFNPAFAHSLLTGYGLMATTVIIQLVLVPLYLSHLGKAKFGTLAMILAINNYAAIGITWLSGGMARVLAERAARGEVSGFRAAYAFSKIIYLSYAMVALVIFWIIAPWLLADALADYETRFAIILSCIYFLLSYEYNADRQAFIARHLQYRGNLREAAGQIVFACIVIVGLLTGMGLPGVVVGQIAGIVVTRILAWYHWRRDGYELGWTWPIENAKALWSRVVGSTGRHYIVYGILLLTLQADVILIGWLGNTETAANYYLVWRIPEIVILLLWRIPGSYAPYLIALDSRGEFQQLTASYRKGLISIGAMAGLAALVYGLLGSWILNLWIGPDAPQASFAYLLAAVAMFFLASARWPSEIAYSLLNTAALVKIAALETVAKLMLIFMLFGRFDYQAPLLAISIVHAFGVFYLYLWLGKNSCDYVRLSAQRPVT